ncbi:aromatic ring-hydroxylating oxygenase subunit alpha [Streptomyces hydrogenans]|uniref:aromatic ring-hydroxylating oxygenase subunit alpha n=1 Tax=Streptomyces hydrogenans TaxID=1873719 RepID=UPI00167E843A|nr:aromatic ring-hydroxylating dioxygenase subunit alpha [Streptomyces hydrogenans]GHG43259.1 (2Fe-2S)-binding protein [Streptomyces hydrogenans]
MSSDLTKRDQAERAMRHSWFPVARSTDLATPQAATLLGEKLVVWRSSDGTARVSARRCPHRGADLSQGVVTDGSLGCPYHGWRFDGADGHCTSIPSLADQSGIPPKAAIRTYPAVERFGHVWTVLEEPVTELYDPEEWRDRDLVWLAADPLSSSTGVAVAIENFRDVAHFPFVHQVSMGPTPEVVEPLQVRRDGIDVRMDHQLDAGSGDWAAQGDCLMSYHCVAPGLASISYRYAVAGLRVVAGFPSPVSYDEVRIFWGVANERDFKGASLEECLRVEEMVYLEDLPITANIEPREVPWDAEVPEFSAPADLFTLNYRRAFHELMRRTAEFVETGTPRSGVSAP